MATFYPTKHSFFLLETVITGSLALSMEISDEAVLETDEFKIATENALAGFLEVDPENVRVLAITLPETPSDFSPTTPSFSPTPSPSKAPSQSPTTREPSQSPTTQEPTPRKFCASKNVIASLQNPKTSENEKIKCFEIFVLAGDCEFCLAENQAEIESSAEHGTTCPSNFVECMITQEKARECVHQG